ncbi:MAG: peptide ABC transporter ATP-binding protein [Devosia sp. 67-54]|uniref:ABC transporter ATP-binding protein n=1 Tax=unclassified Devosia TaxID=196773 RepID=UPI00095B53C2|nr:MULTISPECIES: oligopeptide/dipeptide ABC transporter ATP-binding protein [unclassified Devosia]MBN9306749.1 ATP-binding cassette domain-containing protein [Devosia sp.]OJX16008.1 MAG: peptide ABC transporter ATP-binding protein [Devosia sp. 67-54]
MSTDPLLKVVGLKKYYPIESGPLRRVTGHVKAVDDVSFELARGEVLGLVGESGCGKTTLGRCIVRAIDPTGGVAQFVPEGGITVDLAAAGKRELREVRRYMNMVFQDPFSSLSPRMTVREIIGEPLRAQKVPSHEITEKVERIAQMCGLNPAHLSRYPNAFSGGQRQRICIARALVTDPVLVVADEPVSALDVSIQAQILNLLQRLQQELGLSFIFVAHDLSVVEHIANRVAVMYVGKIVELSDTEDLYARPRHPYTEALLSAVPQPDPDVADETIILGGEVASAANPPSGCYFHPRCRYAREVCQSDAPPLREVVSGHFAACHFAESLQLKGVVPEPEKEQGVP